MSHTQLASTPVIPRPALIAAGVIVIGTTIAAGLTSRYGAHGTPDFSAPVAARDVSFEDQPGGAVRVRSAGHDIALLPPGTNGFLRSTMRGFVRARRSRGEGDAAPFHLTAWQDGRLTLDDPVTGRRVDLEAFGHTNEGVFARLVFAKGANP